MSSGSTPSRRFLLAVGIVAGVLSALIVLPFLNWILVAVILAYVLLPLHRRLAAVLPAGVSAGVSILIGLVAIVLPIATILIVAANQTRQLVANFDPQVLSEIDDVIATQFGVRIDVSALQETFSGAVTTGARGVVGNLFGILGGLPELFLGLTVMFFALFYMLKDGERAVEWLRWVLPLEADAREELFDETSLLLYNSLVGTAVVAGVQAVLLGIAFSFAGVSNVVFWTVTAFIAAMIPIIGTSIVYIPAAAYLLIVGRLLPAIAVLLFGVLVISTVDNILRPMVMRRGAQLNPVFTIIGIFGGIALFGVVGLFVGPIVLGVTKLVVEILVREYSESGDVGDPEGADVPAEKSPKDEHVGEPELDDQRAKSRVDEHSRVDERSAETAVNERGDDDTDVPDVSG